MTKKLTILLLGSVLILVSTACGLGSLLPERSASDEAPALDEASAPAAEAVEEEAEQPAPAAQSDFPLTTDAKNVMTVAGSVNYETGMSIDAVMDYYRQVLTQQGLTERQLLTIASDNTFSMVFDGHASGDAIVIQGVKLNGTTNVNIRFEDV